MRLALVSLVLPLAACGSPQAPARSEPAPAVEPVAPAPDLGDWGRETIELPPDFAPSLPAGHEELLFAPGMFAEGEELWSYAFVLRLEEALPDAERLGALLDLYYDGLITAVGGQRGVKVGANPAHVLVRETGPGRFAVDVALVDAFVTGEALILHMRVRAEPGGPGTSLLRITASPQPDDHPVWPRLEAALSTLTP